MCATHLDEYVTCRDRIRKERIKEDGETDANEEWELKKRSFLSSFFCTLGISDILHMKRSTSSNP